jgi:hypothetical protein
VAQPQEKGRENIKEKAVSISALHVQITALREISCDFLRHQSHFLPYFFQFIIQY